MFGAAIRADTVARGKPILPIPDNRLGENMRRQVGDLTR